MLNKLANKILIVILFFSYIYEIHYNIFPWDFPVMLGLVSILTYIISPKLRTYCQQENWDILRLSITFFPILLVALVSLIINQTSDLYFIKLAILTPIRLFGLIPIILLIKQTYGNVHYTTILRLFLTCGIIQIFLAFSMWFIPGLRDNLYSLLASTELSDMILERTDGYRLNGFGTNFFGSGIIHGFMLILTMLLLLSYDTQATKHIVIISIFLIIFAGGMMMARTTVIGAAFAVFLYVISQKSWQYTTKLLLGFIAILCFCFLIFSRVISSYFEQFEVLFTFGFEMVLNYFTSGKLSTESTDVMMNMYVFPDNLSTWLIGDGIWTDPQTGFYYKGTDIGYCRMIFYFGSLGTTIFFACCKKIVSHICNRGIGLNKFIFSIFFIYICILNLKGFTGLFTLLFPFYFCDRIEKV